MKSTTTVCSNMAMNMSQLILHSYIDQLLSLLGWSIFSSIVVSISACHHHWQLAGDRGSIPRWRVSFCQSFCLFPSLFCSADFFDFDSGRSDSQVTAAVSLARVMR